MSDNKQKDYFKELGPLGANPQRGRTQDEIDQTSLDVGERFSNNFLDVLRYPSLSSFYKVRLDLSSRSGDNFTDSLEDWLWSSGVYDNAGGLGQERFALLATEAMLPGATFATSTETGSRQGVVEKFAAQRTFNDVAVTYYLTGDYKSLTLFQEWINYINPIYKDESGRVDSNRRGYANQLDNNQFFRHRYPAQYKRSMSITKFERDIDKTLANKKGVKNGLSNLPTEGFISTKNYKPEALSYKFINVFPTSIQDVALSYAQSQVLQVTVNFAYDRYVMVRNKDVSGYDGGELIMPSSAAKTLTGDDNPDRKLPAWLTNQGTLVL
ncbi:hypothetical protein CYVG_00192 [Cyanophage S-SSM6a]|uniref:Uncharacterized protein n=1 Tax=Synechococcus phage S-SSM7 TaxID=445686 RepID=E3SKS7_9CAUD|nr:hypothetical protein SSSM7_009 [Synechococcus phage S-SSM7]ADO98075.1 hypothetical protein SSSM7_009 [Synechococcus phage S-SSM7]AGH07635.1 hypothetical protein CYVG_00192 [Cyanophage S-SSM6a]